jgi:hypothetical protein
MYVFLGDVNSIFAFDILNVCVFGHRLHDNTTLITKILKRNRLAKFLSTVETNSVNFDSGHVKEVQNHVFWS